jgi:hypothetical protein
LPLCEHEVDATVPFEPDERLFRRFPPSELVDREITPASLNSMSFDVLEPGAPSVIRERFGTACDALHADCAGGKDVSNFLVFSIKVREVPKGIQSGDGRVFDFFPRHSPMPKCGAHSVISCCSADDPSMTYVVPSKSARQKLRTGLVSLFQKDACKNGGPDSQSPD